MTCFAFIIFLFSSKLINFYLVWNQFTFFTQTSVAINININEIFMKLVLILRLFFFANWDFFLCMASSKFVDYILLSSGHVCMGYNVGYFL